MEIKEELLKKAVMAKENAYAPYSNYKVGAAILADDNKIYASCNVENVSFPCGTCAEAGAIAAMVAGGAKKIQAVLITSDSESLVYPCGACLQRIAEFANGDIEIHLASFNKIRQTHRLSDLLPHNFSAKELSHD